MFVARVRYYVRAYAAVLPLVAIVTIAPGCSFLVGSKQRVTITATDQQAEIFVDGMLVGTGVASPELKRNKSHSVMAKVGDRAGVYHIGTEVSRVGVADIIGGFIILVPFLGLLAPGFNRLDTDQVTIAIPPEQPDRREGSLATIFRAVRTAVENEAYVVQRSEFDSGFLRLSVEVTDKDPRWAASLGLRPGAGARYPG